MVRKVPVPYLGWYRTVPYLRTVPGFATVPYYRYLQPNDAAPAFPDPDPEYWYWAYGCLVCTWLVVSLLVLDPGLLNQRLSLPVLSRVGSRGGGENQP